MSGLAWVCDDNGTEWIDRPSVESVMDENERMRTALVALREHLSGARDEARKPAHRWWYAKRIGEIDAALSADDEARAT